MLRILMLLLTVVLVTGCSGSFTRISNSEKTLHAAGEVPGQSREQLYEATKIWMEKNFTMAARPIVDEDVQKGTVVGNGQVDYPCSLFSCLTKSGWKVSFLMKVAAANGEIRTTFWDLNLSSPPQGRDAVFDQGMRSPVWSRRDLEKIRPLLMEVHADLLAELRRGAY